jgi:hypothetical protein
MINFCIDKTYYFDHNYNGTIYNERAIEFYLVTLPIGWNKEMDRSIKDNISKFSWIGYFKVNESPLWEMSEDIDKIMSFEYGRPFTSANSIICLYKDTF